MKSALRATEIRELAKGSFSIWNDLSSSCSAYREKLDHGLGSVRIKNNSGKSIFSDLTLNYIRKFKNLSSLKYSMHTVHLMLLVKM